MEAIVDLRRKIPEWFENKGYGLYLVEMADRSRFDFLSRSPATEVEEGKKYAIAPSADSSPNIRDAAERMYHMIETGQFPAYRGNRDVPICGIAIEADCACLVLVDNDTVIAVPYFDLESAINESLPVYDSSMPIQRESET